MSCENCDVMFMRSKERQHAVVPERNRPWFQTYNVKSGETSEAVVPNTIMELCDKFFESVGHERWKTHQETEAQSMLSLSVIVIQYIIIRPANTDPLLGRKAGRSSLDHTSSNQHQSTARNVGRSSLDHPDIDTSQTAQSACTPTPSPFA